MDISVIIVNFNTKEITARCVESFLRNKENGINIEIIIVDNFSTDGSKEYFQNKYSNIINVKMIFNGSNYGFGVANNMGVRLAVGKYIAFANSDTYIENFSFKNLMNCFNECDNIGALSCKILYADDSIQTTGFNYPSICNDIKLNVFFWNYRFIKKYRYKKYIDRGLFRKDWVSGCFFMCKKDLFLKVTGFDPKIFMYAEDLDICIRFSNTGAQNYVYDKEKIYHLHGQSIKTMNLSLKRMLSSKRSYYYVLKKNNITDFKIFIYLINIIHTIALFIFIYSKQKIAKNFYYENK